MRRKALAHHLLDFRAIRALHAGLQHDDGFDDLGMLRVWLLVINLKTAKAALFSIVIPTPRVSLHFTKENEPLAER